ncbi:MAG: TMEM165/GDT1 family protein [Gammaproteobacteria bacterium]|nr:TMEM165/GDT1 family protein [Gammaproteobacteria bacterium]
MEAFWVSALLVGMAEIGDKSLFVTILLTVRYQRPWPIFFGLIAGIACNLALAAGFGAWLADAFDGDLLRWILGLAFIGMAVWSLIPESTESDDGVQPISRGGLFLTAAVTYFMLEMGDKTQLATLALAARFDVFLPVLAGAVLGLVAANAPAIWLGHRFAARLPVARIRLLSAALFTLVGGWILLEVSGRLG